jgi:hypothetical protein
MFLLRDLRALCGKSLPSPRRDTIAKNQMTHENAKPVELSATATAARLGNRRAERRPGAAKYTNYAIVSWDPYDARKTAKLPATRDRSTPGRVPCPRPRGHVDSPIHMATTADRRDHATLRIIDS